MGTIKFYSFIPEVLEKMPIVKSSQISFEWVEKVKNFEKQNSFFKEKTSKCPGIFSILGTGWVQRTYQNILIKTNGDGNTFIGACEIDQCKTKNGDCIGSYISSHSPDQLSLFKPFPANTLASVIKIQSPWFVEIPKGYALLMMPIPYSDETRFTAATGILRGNQFLNVQLYWHCLNGEEVIRAGTPLNQMILIKDEEIEYNLSYIENVTDLTGHTTN